MPNYYPNETNKKATHVIDKQQRPDCLYDICSSQALATDALAATVWCPKSWQAVRASLNFTSTNAKDYSIAVQRGIGIVTGLNDRLWFKVDGTPCSQVTIPEGFYTGTTMAAALVTALAASALPSASKPFTASYNAGTGLFTIAPAAGTVQLFVVNTTVRVRRESTAALALGFNADSSKAASISSNTSVASLGTKLVLVSGTSSASTNVMSTDTIAMTINDQLAIDASGATAGTATYEVIYRTLDV